MAVMKDTLVSLRRLTARVIAPGFVAIAVMLGGASREGILANATLQTLSAIVVLALLLSPRTAAPTRAGYALLAIFGVFVLTALAQLVPLPAGVWAELPGRASVADGFRALGTGLPPLPVSLAPSETVKALMAFLPAVAGFALAVGLGARRVGANLAIGVAIAAALSCLLGVIQIATGVNSPAYLYDVTNRGNPVGFFANVNHQATLCLMTFPFLAALAGRMRLSFAVGERDYAQAILLAALCIMAPLGVMIAGSGAGYGLFGPALIASLFLLRGKRVSPAGLLVLAGLAGGLYGLGNIVASSPILSNLGIPSPFLGPGTRSDAWLRSFEAMKDTFPVGIGLGAFVPFFPAYEDPSIVNRWFWNHAHNDYVEFVLEMGAAGPVLLALLIGWVIWRTVRVWSKNDSESAPYARAASIALFIVMAHSIVDYPLRTGAIAALAGVCLGLLALDPSATSRSSRRHSRERSHQHAHLEI